MVQYVIVKSLKEAEDFKQAEKQQITEAEKYVSENVDVISTEVWMNGLCPSHVCGLNSYDDIVVCVPLHH